MAGVRIHNPITSNMKVVAVVGVIGLLAYDGIQLGVHHVNATDTANEAARAAADVLFQASATSGTQPVLIQACQAAISYAKDHGDAMDIKDCVINADRSVDVTITGNAQEILIGRFSKDLVSFRVKGHADKEG